MKDLALSLYDGDLWNCNEPESVALPAASLIDTNKEEISLYELAKGIHYTDKSQKESHIVGYITLVTGCCGMGVYYATPMNSDSIRNTTEFLRTILIKNAEHEYGMGCFITTQVTDKSIEAFVKYGWKIIDKDTFNPGSGNYMTTLILKLE